MRIALYIEQGLEQIVLTPETETERGILRKLEDGSRELSIKQGAFYECRGGWVRQKAQPYGNFATAAGRADDDSTIIVLREKSA